MISSLLSLLEVTVPVFLVIGFGYVAVWSKLFADEWVVGLMKFTQNFAIPALLFRAISTLDLSVVFEWRLYLSFYTGATLGFFAGLIGARVIFARPWEDSIAIGFCCLFSNSVLLGLPIMERAYGPDAMEGNYAIVAVHAPFAYGIGITAMEIVRNRGTGLASTSRAVLNAMFRNSIILGIGLGLLANFTGFNTPVVLADALELMGRAALPAALFGLGGILFRYRPEGDFRTIGFIAVVSLLLHPLITFAIGRLVDLPEAAFRSAIVTAAMAPGVNGYVFANMYGVARRVAASAVLLATLASVLTASLWLAILGG